MYIVPVCSNIRGKYLACIYNTFLPKLEKRKGTIKGKVVKGSIPWCQFCGYTISNNDYCPICGGKVDYIEMDCVPIEVKEDIFHLIYPESLRSLLYSFKNSTLLSPAIDIEEGEIYFTDSILLLYTLPSITNKRTYYVGKILSLNGKEIQELEEEDTIIVALFSQYEHIYVDKRIRLRVKRFLDTLHKIQNIDYEHIAGIDGWLYARYNMFIQGFLKSVSEINISKATHLLLEFVENDILWFIRRRGPIRELREVYTAVRNIIRHYTELSDEPVMSMEEKWQEDIVALEDTLVRTIEDIKEILNRTGKKFSTVKIALRSEQEEKYFEKNKWFIEECTGLKVEIVDPSQIPMRKRGWPKLYLE